MKTWNYRVLYNGIRYWVGEVYYNEHGVAEAYTEGGVLDDWEQPDELYRTVGMLGEALTQKVIVVNPATEKFAYEDPPLSERTAEDDTTPDEQP